MPKYTVATFTQWNQSNGRAYPYNTREIKADSEAEAIDKYTKSLKPKNPVGILTE